MHWQQVPKKPEKSARKPPENGGVCACFAHKWFTKNTLSGYQRLHYSQALAQNSTGLHLMKNKPQLELADVKKIAAAAEAEALKHQWPVSIAIVDDGGHLLWLQRLDGAAAISAHIAPAKAHAAALGRRDTKGYEDMINTGRSAFLSVTPIAPGGLLEGGVAIMHNGQCLGAVGVSGVKAPEDAQVAKAGIAALAL
jgi:glc operon protein GlcG